MYYRILLRRKILRKEEKVSASIIMNVQDHSEAIGVHATKVTAATQLQQFKLGRSAFQAKVDSAQ